MDFSFNRTRIDKIPRDKILEELERVAQSFKYVVFGRRDFAKVANMSDAVVLREFGTWRKALKALDDRLAGKGLKLTPRSQYNRISDKQLFDEMERVWVRLNHRPSKIEWHLSGSKISQGAYERHFGGWSNACLKFIEYKMGKDILVEDNMKIDTISTEQASDVGIKKHKRAISLSIRLAVLKRDGFRCVLCGRSPAIERGVILHIDHILPVAKGGESKIENLQTLCKDCNLGKSDNTD